MKNCLLFCISILISFMNSSINAQNKFPDSNDCNVKNITLSSLDEKNLLFDYIVDNKGSGAIEFTPFSINEIGGWEVFYESLVTDPNITFEFVGMTRSRTANGVYYRYQEYYMGLPVVGGGFSIAIENNGVDEIVAPPCDGCPGPTDPCNTISYLFADIYENFDLEAVIGSSQIDYFPNSLRNQHFTDNQIIEKSNLNIRPNLNSCDYLLAWKIDYIDLNKKSMISWIDAQTGDILHETSLHRFKNAPTSDYGIQFMNDEIEEGQTFLRNDQVGAHDLSAGFGNPGIDYIEDAINSFSPTNIPRSPAIEDWDNTHASTEIYQAFWMSDQILSLFKNELNIDVKYLKVGIHATAEGALQYNSGSIPDDEWRIGLGLIEGESTAEYDVIGHEIGHAIIGDYGVSYAASVESGSIHEGLADCFGTYAEAMLDPSGLDWVQGDNSPILAGGIDRDMQNTHRNCYTDVLDESIEHWRGEPLGHWFYLCINGDATNNIAPIEMTHLMNIILEALAVVESNPDYPHLMTRTIEQAERLYGICSSELRSIVNAWEQICVPTDHQLANPDELCTSLTGGGVICEENDYFSVCLSETSGLNLGAGRWTVIGRNSTSFESTNGMQGNYQNGGSCIQIVGIPEMPYYPQRITIVYWNPGIGQQISRRVTIADCDGDDPTCSDYYGINGLRIDNEISNSPFQENDNYDIVLFDADTEKEQIKTLIFDLMGNKLDLSLEEIRSFEFGRPVILVITQWDKYGNLINSQKILAN